MWIFFQGDSCCCIERLGKKVNQENNQEDKQILKTNFKENSCNEIQAERQQKCYSKKATGQGKNKRSEK